MSKIAIISQPDQGVLIDVSGCTTLKDALDHLSSTLQVSNNFWHGMKVSINLGALAVHKDELLEILALAKGVGISPAGVYTTSADTIAALKACNIPLGAGKPMTLPAVTVDSAKMTTTEIEEDRQKTNPLATITMRMVDAVTRRGGNKETVAEPTNELEDMAREDFDDRKETHETTFPHVKPKRKVSLDGKRVQTVEGDSSAQSVKRASKAETLDTVESVRKSVSVGESDHEIAASSKSGAHDQKLYAQTVEMKALQVPAAATVTAEVVAEPVRSGTEDEPISKEDQAITGPHAEIKVTTIQVHGDGMLEAQPAQTALAQGATISGETFTQQVDADAEEPEIVDAVEEVDVESTEEFDIEEEVESDAMSVGRAARGGPTTLYIRQNLRSGQTVSHKGHLVIIGDINPGAEVMADGDITVWGCLRGVAHAGIGGNVNAEIRALKLQPIQIRIAHAIARAPDRPRVNYATTNGPETARMVDGKIRVVRSRLD